MFIYTLFRGANTYSELYKQYRYTNGVKCSESIAYINCVTYIPYKSRLLSLYINNELLKYGSTQYFILFNINVLFRYPDNFKHLANFFTIT